MKKFLIVLFSALLALCSVGLLGCNKSNSLENSLSELRYQVYEGQSSNYKVKAVYGFKEDTYFNDGKVGDKVYLLSFRLNGKETDEQTYYINFDFNGKSYQGEFKLHPTHHTLCCDIEVANFNQQSFTASIGTLAEKETVTFNSVIPKGTLTYIEALDSLQKNQSALLKNYYDEKGNFNAEIYERLIVKDGKAYWYIGIASGNGRLKALLIDGKNGEVLATREVF